MKLPLPRLTRLAALVVACLPLSGGAQAPEPPAKPPGPPGPREFREPRELRDLREQSTLRALAAGRMLADQYSNALATLESQAADSADYETALAVQQRRRDLADLYANRDLDPSHTIVLKPSEAKTVGAVSLDKTDGTLTNWRNAGSSAAWDVVRIVPGSYTVTMTYGVAGSADTSTITVVNGVTVDQATGGEVEFSEVTGLSAADAGKLSASVKPTGGWAKFETATLGEIKLNHTSVRLALKATRLRGAGGLMHLKEIRLTPSRPTADAPDREVAKAAGDELAKLRAEHLAKLKTLEQPVVNAHLARLTRLADDLIARKDEEGAQAIVAEAKRAQKSLEKTDRATRNVHGGVLSEGLEEVHDAVYVDDPTNTGDRFLIAARGEKFSVKLMSVSCPSPNPEDKSSHGFHAGYFGITKEDSIMIGRQAQDFTSAYLKDKPLKLLTRWQKDKMNSVLAIVLPGDPGDFAGILVDNGLAAVLEPGSKMPTHRRVEENAHSILKQREADAKARIVPPGAWALASEIKPAR